MEQIHRMLSRPRVLLVDDDQDISLALSDYLRQEGYNVDVVETGNAALLKGTTQPYDVVLLDVGLPDRDGIEVLVELSKHKPQLPIVLLTAFTSLHKTTPPDKLNKAFAYLTKPYSREEVKEVLYRSVNPPREATKEARGAEASDPRSFPEPARSLLPSILQPVQSKDEERIGTYFRLTAEEYRSLTERVHLMQFAFDHVLEAILVADIDKRFRYANHAACQALGYTKKELENLGIPDIAPNHDNQRYQEHLKELREGKTLSYHTTHLTKQGEELPITISVYLINFQGQEFTCAITNPREEDGRFASKDSRQPRLSPAPST